MSVDTAPARLATNEPQPRPPTPPPNAAGPATPDPPAHPPVGPRRQHVPPGVIFAWTLRMVAFLAFTFLVALIVITPIQHYGSQNRLYAQLRVALAEGSLPLGQYSPVEVEDSTTPADPNATPADPNADPNAAGGSATLPTQLTEPGAPIALLRIPRLGLREVIVEGTGSAQTALGVGHKRDTVLPGQAGVSILQGRAAAYGGPFRSIATLRSGDTIEVTTAQGIFTFIVRGARLPGDPLPPPVAAGDGRISLLTAHGRPFRPEEVVRVDAELQGEAAPAPASVRPGTTPENEQPMAGDTSVLVPLIFLLQLMVAAAAGGVWLWLRWKRPQAWVVTAPVLLLLATITCTQAIQLLPNLL